MRELAGAAVGPAGPALWRPCSLPPRTPRAMLRPQGAAPVPKVLPLPPSRPGFVTVPVGDRRRGREEEATGFDLDSVTANEGLAALGQKARVPGRWPWWLARLQVASLLCRFGEAPCLVHSQKGPRGSVNYTATRLTIPPSREKVTVNR